MSESEMDKIDILFTLLGFPICLILTVIFKHTIFAIIPFLIKGIYGLVRGRIYLKTFLDGISAYVFSILLLLFFLYGFIRIILGHLQF